MGGRPVVDSHGSHGSPRGDRFTTTRWSLVTAAGEMDNPAARDALAVLCETYWRPVYVYVRRRGVVREEALDLTQGFFARLLEKRYLKDARRERGRFRTFLLTAVKRYLAKEWERARAQKRGGGRPLIPLDAREAEDTYRLEPADNVTPEVVFDRRWARTVLGTALSRLRREMAGRELARRFELLRPYLAGDGPAGYRELAGELELSESAVKVTVHRMRRRLREILRDEVAQTIGDPADVDGELRHLLAVLGS
jgi:RNA polymerase sigma-70 factor (ECF subfamily)